MRPPLALRIVCALGLLALATQAQTPPPKSAPPASPPPGPNFDAEPYLIQTALTDVTLHPDGTSVRTITFAAVVRSEAALRDVGVVSISYASRSEHADFVYVRVLHPDGTREGTPVSSAIDQPAPVTRQAPFYSDLQIKQLPVRSLRLGDTLEWQARFTLDHPEVPQSWSQDTFITNLVCLDETYLLHVPAGLAVKVWTNPRAGAEFSESFAAGIHTYRWRHAALRPTIGPEAEAFRKSEEKRLRTPDEELDAEKGALPSLAWTTFPDWAAVGAWYRGLLAGRTAPDDAIRAKVAELTAGKSSDLEKAQAVYAFVAGRIRYIGVAFGIGRYQPHTAAEVLANQYGDCKDKHTLLASMLSVLGIPADPVLIGAGIRLNSNAPSPASFNHLITQAHIGGKPVLLDTTSEVAAWGALLNVIRDQDALAIPATGPAAVVHTPVDLPYPQTFTSTVVGSLDKDLTSESRITFTLHNDDEIYVRAALRGVSPAQYATVIQGFVGGMGYGGTATEPAFDHLDDPAQPLSISFHYHRLKEKDWGYDRITANFLPISLPAFTSDQPPTSIIRLGPKHTETSTLEMKLPEGWTAQEPDEVHAHAAFATCDVTYHVKDHTLFGERRLAVLQPKVPVADYRNYQTWYDDCGASGFPYIQLFHPPKQVALATAEPPKAPPAPLSPRATPLSNPEAAELVQKASGHLRALDLDAGRKDLDAAGKLNPTEPGLWSGYATIAHLLGKPTEVVADLQHELSFHPDELQLYKLLAGTQLQDGDAAGGLASLRAWVKAAPHSPEAALALVQQLQALKNTAAALTAATEAIQRMKNTDADLSELSRTAADLRAASHRPANPTR